MYLGSTSSALGVAGDETHTPSCVILNGALKYVHTCVYFDEVIRGSQELPGAPGLPDVVIRGSRIWFALICFDLMWSFGAPRSFRGLPGSREL